MTGRTFYLKGPDGRPWVWHQATLDGTTWADVWVGDAPGLRAIVRRAGERWTVSVFRLANGYRNEHRHSELEAESLALAVRRAQVAGDFLLPPGSQMSRVLSARQDRQRRAWASLRWAERRARAGRSVLSGSVVITRTNSHGGKNRGLTA